jgi:hypothetical protein
MALNGSLPAYRTERETRDGKPGLRREVLG